MNTLPLRYPIYINNLEFNLNYRKARYCWLNRVAIQKVQLVVQQMCKILVLLVHSSAQICQSATANNIYYMCHRTNAQKCII